ncbi:hypothetical protein HN51_053939 [Arachis hypogaea]|uniref:Asparagine--tRNA ligase, cytoplasmic n=1 Tax=Arachis hypogaea TaxID=3818 RepID=A0A444XDN2_ARAHY|nr:asparagine--tRNA ligase, cytoplasmic 2 [Arachis ipaensis]XP_025679249.1 asparagine--tRNA ligase, cytoplasmic 2 [Arachis hypogaea]QHN76372.1 Asparagine--tRNA ligase, cytoplasmic [Arachis hypogaea]RYQ87851.1 hypothetical protein Ahy_B09g095391 [Arachis hypogaea]
MAIITRQQDPQLQPQPSLLPFKYSHRVLLKTLLDRQDGGRAFAGQRVVVGGWVKTSKEVQKPLPPPAPAASVPHEERFIDREKKGDKDISCVEMLQSRIPLIRSIWEVFGGGGYGRSHAPSRKRIESAPPKPATPPPPQLSTAYLLITDGSCVASLQVVVESSVAQPSNLLPTGTCILVEGQIERPAKEGKHVIELKADKVLHIGTVDVDKYPLSKKRVPLEMLRDFPQFRPRTTTVATVMRIRNALSFATHSFFNGQGFLDVQIPIITTTDCEGFGKLFQVTGLEQKADKQKLSTIHETDGVSLDIVKAAAKEKSNIVETLKRTESNREALAAAVQDLRKTNELVSQLEAIEKKNLKSLSSKDEAVDASRDLFLTVSGRLHLESYACALGNVYSFGPRFQADKTDSAKHASEMWMVEVEMAFSQLRDAMNCASDYFNHLIMYVLETCHEDMKFIAKRIDNACFTRLQQTASGFPEMLSYNEVIDILRKVEDKKFETNFKSGVALTAEHLSYLVDTIYKKPVMIYDYPKEAKPFYCRLNDNGRTVAAFDLVVPKVGTIISGSQNEERINIIHSRINELVLPREKYEWYLDLHRNGTAKNSGFTLRFDLMVLFITGLTNVRDVIPFPRSYGKANN